jgi:hypothetical protein
MERVRDMRNTVVTPSPRLSPYTRDLVGSVRTALPEERKAAEDIA